MKKQITIICDIETTVPHLLNDYDFEIIATNKDDVWTMIKKDKEPISSNKTKLEVK